MNPSRILSINFALGLLVACTQSNAPNSAAESKTSATANDAAAAKEAALYEQMRAGGSVDIALSLGNEVLQKYPGSAAAAQVQQTIAEVRAKSEAQASQRRLARLWSYVTKPEAGGTQYTAAIASKEPPAKNATLRLVLRQHPKWGQSVYLLLNNATYDCHKGCATLPVSFDGAPAQRMPAIIPPTGEPALFIADDKGFIAKLEKAQRVSIVAPVKDLGDKSFEFEIGGYDPTKMPDKPKK